MRDGPAKHLLQHCPRFVLEVVAACYFTEGNQRHRPCELQDFQEGLIDENRLDKVTLEPPANLMNPAMRVTVHPTTS